MISFSKRPSSVACAARCWDSAAKASRSSRLRPHFSAISSAEMPWGTRPPTVVVARGHLGAEREADVATMTEAPMGTSRHDLDAGGDDDVVGAGHHALGGEVGRLLRRAALAVDGGGRHRLGPAGAEHGVAADVQALGAHLHDATHDHVVDQGRVEVVALDAGRRGSRRRGRPGASPRACRCACPRGCGRRRR